MNFCRQYVYWSLRQEIAKLTIIISQHYVPKEVFLPWKNTLENLNNSFTCRLLLTCLLLNEKVLPEEFGTQVVAAILWCRHQPKLQDHGPTDPVCCYMVCLFTQRWWKTPVSSQRHLRSAERRTTSPTQHVRPPLGFCHCWPVRLEQSSGPCP